MFIAYYYAMFDVVGVGTNSVDEVLLTRENLMDVIASGKGRVQARHVFSGGQTATTLSACSAFGLRSRYIGVFGSDAWGGLVRRALEEHGVDTDRCSVIDRPNRTAVIVVDDGGRRTVLWHRSEGLSLTAGQLEGNALEARLVHVDDDDPDIALRAAQIARSSGTPVTTDIEHVSDRTEQLISTATYPILNEHLSAVLTGEDDPERALRKLRRLNPGLICMTLGERGAAALEGDRFHMSPAAAVSVVDNTGAGDVFRGAFIYAVLQAWAPADILRFANAAAGISCTRLGAIAGVPTHDETRRLLAEPLLN
jgi:sugar/nucleoside kinase (ribokinase family)